MPTTFNLSILNSDEAFDRIYPEYIQEKSNVFWTPFEIGMRAAELLVDHEKTKGLDIGSGVGKFCLIGATHTKGIFHGIEQRKHLVELCNELASTHHVERVKFIHNNINRVDFSSYDAFYLYNPFFESLHQADKLDDSILHIQNHFEVYNLYVKAQFASLPVGTKIVTYHGFYDEIPLSYRAIKKEFDNKLILWVKQPNDEERLYFKEKILGTCVKALREDGFANVNEQNILIDPMLRYISEKIILSQLGVNPVLDEVIEDL